jgi:YgiT-type zinc finger domain-containing protein
MGRPVAKTEKKTMTTIVNNQHCAVCGGEMQATTITHEEKRDNNIYLFQNVPAKVCTACGEIWIDEEVLQEIDKLIEYGVPVRKVETPVYDFPRAVAPAH